MKRIRAVAIIVNDGKILLMHRINNGKEYHVFPGGGVENGETVERAVLREVHEETSLEVKIEKLLYHHIYDDSTEQFFYLCRYVTGEPKLGDGNEARDMNESNTNFYNPVWYETKGLPQLLLYPLEIRDWFIIVRLKTPLYQSGDESLRLKLEVAVVKSDYWGFPSDSLNFTRENRGLLARGSL